MKIYDRHSSEYIETQQYGGGALAFLYGNAAGRVLLKIAINPLTSRIYGFYNSLPISKKKIPDFITEHNIDMSDFEDREYLSFCDFFTRKLRSGARFVDMSDNALISVADSKLLVYEIDDNLMTSIKGSQYTLRELTGQDNISETFRGGLCLVFRLCMDDYHRYCFPDSGRVVSNRYISGRLHTVSSISKDYPIYKENTRNVTYLETDNLGNAVQIEVGAMLVGAIKNHDLTEFNKGDEKGYFEPGGSTIVLLLEKNAAVIDDDIMQQSRSGIETAVKYGEKIGRILPKGEK